MNVEQMAVIDLLSDGASLSGKVEREFMGTPIREQYNEIWGRIL